MTDLNHLDDDGNVHMVDVGAKEPTARVAVAVASVAMEESTRDRLFAGDIPKGDALATVRIAAIQATKRTPDLIPLCHPIAVDRVDVHIEQTDTGASIQVTVGVFARTGVEMEAMVGASVGALALYDMIKGIDRHASVGSVMLLSKTGGRSGGWTRG
ncbi:MAG: cyclic pyranopterin monophosphate synthase MoaC [Acidimicrobiia bacterium]